MDILEKYRPLVERHKKMLELGRNAVGLRMDDVYSPTRARIDDREVILAGTNNYMAITFDRDCIEAGQKALENHGTGTTGSRIANGSYALHLDLEKSLADFLGRRHSIVFSTGYQANLGAIAGIAGPRDTIFLDADSHSSIYDACTLSGARLIRFKHNNADDLAKRLRRMNGGDGDGGGRLVVLEGIYSMFGDRAPLGEFVDIKHEYGFDLLVDEAHSTGVLGDGGRGLAEETGLEGDVDFVVGTFSKSFGAIGGFAASDHELFEMLRFASRAYMFSASPSPSTIATVMEAVRQLATRPELRQKLRQNSERLHHGFKALGLELCCDVPSPIIAVRVADEPTAIVMWNKLLDAGVYVNIALPPGTPNGVCLLRCSVSAGHSEQDIDKIISLFESVVLKLPEVATP